MAETCQSSVSSVVMEPERCFPLLLNASCVKAPRPQVAVVLGYALLSLVSVLTVLLNLLVIVSIAHFKQLHTPSNLLLLSLAVSDFFIGIFLFFQVLLVDGCWILGDLMCSVYQYVAYIVTSASVGTMVLISVDRYVAVCYPLHYSTKVTQTRVQVCVCLCWFCSVFFQSLDLQDVLQRPGGFNSCVGECVFVINYIAGLADVILSFIAPITVIVVLYIRVFVVAVTQARSMRSHVAAVSQRSGKVTQKSELKATRTLGVVVLVFLMCLCPFYCVALTGPGDAVNAASAAFVICWYYFNSCLNPVIYAFYYPWFRKSVKLILTLKIFRSDSSRVNMP